MHVSLSTYLTHMSIVSFTYGYLVLNECEKLSLTVFFINIEKKCVRNFY